MSYEDYIGTGLFLPVLATDQEGKALVFDLRAIEKLDSNQWKSFYDAPAKPLRSDFYEQAIVGDSGRPLFLLVDNEVILLGCFWNGYDTPRSSSVIHFIETIQQTMDELVFGFQLQLFDFQQFQSFSPGAIL